MPNLEEFFIPLKIFPPPTTIAISAPKSLAFFISLAIIILYSSVIILRFSHIDDYKDDLYLPNYIQIKFCNSGSYYAPFNIVFMKIGFWGYLHPEKIRETKEKYIRTERRKRVLCLI